MVAPGTDPRGSRRSSRSRKPTSRSTLRSRTDGWALATRRRRTSALYLADTAATATALGVFEQWAHEKSIATVVITSRNSRI